MCRHYAFARLQRGHLVNHSLKSSALVIALLGSSACSTFNNLESQARVDPRTVVSYQALPKAAQTGGRCDARTLRGDNHYVPLNLDCFYFPGTEPTAPVLGTPASLNRAPVTGTAYQRAAISPGDRNRLAGILMKESDDVCVKEMGDVSAREAIANTLLGTATSALSTASSIVTGQKLKSWLAGGSAFTNATRDHINAEVYRNVLASAMAKAIDNSRKTERGEIMKRLERGIDLYAVDMMIADVNRYHQSCSFFNGLALVVDAVNRAAPETENEYRGLTVGISDLGIAIADLERRVAAATGESKTALQAELNKLLDERTKLLVARANLGSSQPAPAPAPAVVAPPATQGP
jgi:hypothetical protein